ncbi:ATP-binding protein [Paracoccus sp. 1_MG-2023]|uniref:ATP-binding protein n=1 Tax=unclassified Paracoccus (in: a-proteobacteria) TaxID=2688777 RepID=UPI001C0934D0|nr:MULTISPECIES: ATP-binding protein [unclassified Paracoccus (in: a-proteobacteria)]MBU2958984.1 HAMP domain-containing protein [Paracoccus sp. C2R09]MDO6668956.1 ATP-binding protein [Paracoccus sp. 1_MG-2023]
MANTAEKLKTTFLPRGLYARAALILFLPVVVVTLVVSVMFLQRHFDGVTRQMTTSMAREVAFVSSRMQHVADSEAARIAGRSVADPLGVTLRLPVDPPPEDSRLFYDFSGRVVIEVLRESLPNIISVDLASDDKRVEVALPGDFGAYQLGFDRRRVSASNPHQLLVLMVFTSFLMTGIATIFLRNQLRPIRRLAHAAEEYGKGRMVAYRPQGAAEIRIAGTAFLDMRNRLERQNEQRKLMMSGISHDLRTPLTRLRLGLSVLSPDLPPEPDEIAAMEADIAEMNRMVDGFLDYARDDAQERPPQPMVVSDFLEAIVADAQRAGQAVVLRGFDGDAQGLATFRADMLRRSIENLIGNAVRYGNRAELDATLGPRSLRIGVEDDGPGIPEDSIEAAMRPFTRLDPARNRNSAQGAGLGLAIAGDVARGHGGQLRLGRGTRLGGLRAEIVIPR